MSKTILIAYSGGCFSGKTTSIDVCKIILEKYYKVKKLDELMRKLNICSIDKVRQESPRKYMDIQDEIIRKKMKQEKICHNENYDRDTIILIDRAITDSLFYLTHYVQLDRLDEARKIKYENLVIDVKNYLIDTAPNIYDIIFQFVPLNIDDNSDVYRTKDVNTKKYVEYKHIKENNETYLKDKLEFIDLNSISLEQMTNFWTVKLKEMKLID